MPALLPQQTQIEGFRAVQDGLVLAATSSSVYDNDRFIHTADTLYDALQAEAAMPLQGLWPPDRSTMIESSRHYYRAPFAAAGARVKQDWIEDVEPSMITSLNLSPMTMTKRQHVMEPVSSHKSSHSHSITKSHKQHLLSTHVHKIGSRVSQRLGKMYHSTQTRLQGPDIVRSTLRKGLSAASSAIGRVYSQASTLKASVHDKLLGKKAKGGRLGGVEDSGAAGEVAGGKGEGHGSEVALTSPLAKGGKGGKFPCPASVAMVAVAATIMVKVHLDGGLKEYDASKLGDGGQGEHQKPVFELADGATLSNVIIGGTGADGIHCLGSCTLINCWFRRVGEDAITFKGNRTDIKGVIKGGGAMGAIDKVIQFNSGGTVTISDYYVQGFSKFCRSCGNCKSTFKRHFILNNIVAVDGKAMLVGINSNEGDTATISGVKVVGKQIPLCVGFHSAAHGSEPKKATGPGPGCHVTGGIGSSSDMATSKNKMLPSSSSAGELAQGTEE